MYVRDYVERLLDEERLAIIESYEQFERDGFIGDCAVRHHAEQLVKEMGVAHEGRIILWMEQLANAAYRHYALLYLHTR